MSTNSQLVEIFQQTAAALELLGSNPFKINANTRVARLLKEMTTDVGELVTEDPSTALGRLTAISGIGKGTAERIFEFVDTGQVTEHRELMERIPKGLFELLDIPGLGPKAVKLLWQELEITNLEGLKAKLDSPELAALPRMGAKTIQNLKKAIEFAEKTQDRIPLGVARPIALEMLAHLEALDSVQKVVYAGSLRRGRETIGDLDFLVACGDPEAVREHFTTLPSVTQILARGETKSSVRLEVRGVALQADLRIVDLEAFGAALMYFTGSKEHNVRLREIAIKKGLRLNEYGLFEGKEERPQDRGAKPLAAKTEAEIYQVLGLPLIEPEMREDRGELENRPDELIEVSHIRAELHSHTVASDGKLTIDELAQCAIDRGFHTLAITDHSQSSVIANGLKPDRLLRHIDAIHEANDRISEITLLAGAEVDILTDGRLDYEDDILARLDVVVASPHASLRQTPEVATERLLKAIAHPLVHIIGHPTGRIINRREGLSPNMDALFAAAVEHDTALELNANWHRLDLRDSHLRAALAQGVKIAIDTDAHDGPHLDFLIYGVLTARRAGLPPQACINTWSAEKLHGWLKSKR
ncbi:MAG: DNA polymerase/3'-5' exonuclease PolX [Deltaproteobacteria bacterium]|nr:DNA polymerase/3'-5' exonuclease PolX [Deltaproteobacteria bacterium]